MNKKHKTENIGYVYMISTDYESEDNLNHGCYFTLLATKDLHEIYKKDMHIYDMYDGLNASLVFDIDIKISHDVLN